MSPIAPEAPTFNSPIAPAPDIDRDGEMLNYYFDSTWTTKDIADHFKLTVPQVAAWFQRSDIAALIDFVTAANDRRARDIARENLPGTIDILLRISRLRNDDKVSRAAASALISFSRGRAAVAKRAAKQAKAQENVQSTASDRSRSATSAPPRGIDTSIAPSPHPTNTSEAPDQSRDDDTCAELEIALAPGRSPDVPRPMPSILPLAASDESRLATPAPDPLVLHSSPPHAVAC